MKQFNCHWCYPDLCSTCNDYQHYHVITAVINCLSVLSIHYVYLCSFFWTNEDCIVKYCLCLWSTAMHHIGQWWELQQAEECAMAWTHY